MKTGKEEIVGLLVALERYAARDEEAEEARWTAVSERLAGRAGGHPGPDRPDRRRPRRTAGRSR